MYFLEQNLVPGIGYTDTRRAEKIKKEDGKATQKLTAAGSHTPRLEGQKEEVVLPQHGA